MNKSKLPVLGAIILIAAIMLPWQKAEAREQMRINRVGISQSISYDNELVAMVGDSLALFDYVVSGNTVTLKRRIVTPSATVRPFENIYSFSAPTNWGTFSNYPIYFKHKNGKLYSAFLSSTKIMVLFTDAETTVQHVFDRTGVNVANDPGFVIVDEELAWCGHSSYPGGTAPKIYRLDFTTHTLQLFHEATGVDTGWYWIFELAGDYFLMVNEAMSAGPDLLVQGFQIVNTYPEHWVHWLPYYIIYAPTPITDQLSYLSISDGLDRNQSWNVVTWVEDNNLLMAQIPDGDGNPYAYGYIYDFLPNTSTSFSSIYGIGMGYPPEDRDPDVFKNWQLTDGSLQEMGGWPDLTPYQGAMELFRLNPDYGVAISRVGDEPYTFSLIEYPTLSIRNYLFAVGPFIRSAYSSNHFYLIGTDGRVHSFVLEMGSPNSDEHIPPITTSLSVSPNPFRGNCAIEINSAKAGPAKLCVYNLRGQLVQTLHQELLTSGSHSIQWDASAHPSGVYFLRLERGKEIITRKVLLSQ